jgi:hypothetical protein
MLRGSCLCGGIQFEIEGRVSPIAQCHCSLCRKASGAAGNASFLTAARSLRWLKGQELVRSWRKPSGWGTDFCSVCGCPVPRMHPNGKIVGVPAGLLDDDPGVPVGQHIFVGSKASWDQIGGSAPQHDEWSPETAPEARR